MADQRESAESETEPLEWTRFFTSKCGDLTGAWPAVAERARGYDSQVTLQIGDATADAKDLKELEALAPGPDPEEEAVKVKLRAVGPDSFFAISEVLAVLGQQRWQASEASKSEARLKFVNRLGLHSRAAAKLVHTAEKYRSDVLLFADGDRDFADMKSILGLLNLGLASGSEATVRAVGPDADEAVLEIARLVASGFNEF